MQKTLPTLCRPVAVVMAALVLVGCSGGGRSLLALENEKAGFRPAPAHGTGASQQEVDQERRSADAVTAAMVTRVGASSDLAMSDHLQAMANKLAHAIKADNQNFRIVLLKSNKANAFTPGAGTILINEGLLQFADNEAQVAAVMAHEMAHLILKHPQRQKQIRLASRAGGHFMDDYTPNSLADNLGRILRIGGNVTMNGMIRQQELMADSIGIDILVKAGYDPREMTAILRKLRAIAPLPDRATNVVYGNHPLTADRVEAAAKKIRRNYPDAFGVVSSPRFEALVEPYHHRRMKRLAVGAQRAIAIKTQDRFPSPSQ
jgi:predicted Zn-dependent protease